RRGQQAGDARGRRARRRAARPAADAVTGGMAGGVARRVATGAAFALLISLAPPVEAADPIDRVGNALDRTGAYIGRKLGVDQGARARSTPAAPSPVLVEESRAPNIAPIDRDAAAGRLRDGLARQASATSDADRDAASALIVEAAELGDPDAQYL